MTKLTFKEQKKSLLDFFGKWPGSKKELANISKELEHEHHLFKTREIN